MSKDNGILFCVVNQIARKVLLFIRLRTKIGDGSEIGPNSVIYENVTIGKESRVMANVTIREGCILGDRVIIQPSAVIGSDGYGYEFSNGRHVKIDQVGIVEIGSDVEIGANSTIDRARFGRTRIGKGTLVCVAGSSVEPST